MRDKLEQYRDLLNEIAILQEELNNLEYDKAYGSDPEWPYTEISVNIVGFSQERRTKYQRMLNRASKLELELLGWIEGIPDSATRQVFLLRYVKGLPWKEIGRKMGYAETTVRHHIHDKFLRKLG